MLWHPYESRSLCDHQPKVCNSSCRESLILLAKWAYYRIVKSRAELCGGLPRTANMPPFVLAGDRPSQKTPTRLNTGCLNSQLWALELGDRTYWGSRPGQQGAGQARTGRPGRQLASKIENCTNEPVKPFRMSKSFRPSRYVTDSGPVKRLTRYVLDFAMVILDFGPKKALSG